jgi:hypothetical protein
VVIAVHPDHPIPNVKFRVLLVVGLEDEALVAAQFESTLRPLVPLAEIKKVEGMSHSGIVVNEEAIEIVRKWLQAQ